MIKKAPRGTKKWPNGMKSMVWKKKWTKRKELEKEVAPLKNVQQVKKWKHKKKRSSSSGRGRPRKMEGESMKGRRKSEGKNKSNSMNKGRRSGSTKKSSMMKWEERCSK